MADRAFIATAVSDKDDRLIEADELLSELQHSCGGTIPGKIAIPMLLDLVIEARKSGTRISRNVEAFGDGERVSSWVEVHPASDRDECRIGIATWHTESLHEVGADEMRERKAKIDRQSAEMLVQLDHNQAILAASAQGPHLTGLAEKMDQAKGRIWTDFVDVVGNSHRQPLHWRLLDGAKVAVQGSNRDWKAVLQPRGMPVPGSEGFLLLLVADQAPHSENVPADDAAEDDQIGLGHEIAPVLRKPINRIIANAETIRGRLAGPISDEYSNYAADIATAGQHLLALIDDLADLEVVESPEFTVAPDQIDLADVADRAIGILGVRAQEKQITLVGPTREAKAPAIGEFRRVLQVLLNLIGNAINYSDLGGRVEVSLEVSDKTAQVSVSDTGPGMDDAQQAVAFEKFERLGRSGDGGTGLGLYISRKIARAMDGELTVTSEIGNGACFTLSLPAQK